MTYFVSRHAGARRWIEGQGIGIDRIAAELDPAWIEAGDRVVGTLPVHVAAEVCRRGGRYIHLSLDLPLARRGKELDMATMERHGARLEEFVIRRAERCG